MRTSQRQLRLSRSITKVPGLKIVTIYSIHFDVFHKFTGKLEYLLELLHEHCSEIAGYTIRINSDFAPRQSLLFEVNIKLHNKQRFTHMLLKKGCKFESSLISYINSMIEEQTRKV